MTDLLAEFGQDPDFADLHLACTRECDSLPQAKRERHDMTKRASASIVRMAQIARAAGDRAMTPNQSRDYHTALREAQNLHQRASGADLQRSIDGFEGASGTDAEEYAKSLARAAAQTVYRPGEGRMVSDHGHSRNDDVAAVLTRSENLIDTVPMDAPGRGLSMNSYVRAMVTGDWSGIEPEARAMSIGTPSAGGFAVPTPLSATIIDKARAKTRVFQAGALTVPMDANTLKIARVITDGTAAWKVENAASTASDLVLDAVTLTSHTLMAIVKASVELVEDAAGIDGTIENSLAQAFAIELDRVALRGSGTGAEPTGIRNQAGVTIQSLGANGATPTYGNFSTAIQTVRENNGEPNAIIFAPRTAGTLDRLVDTTNQPLRPPPSVDAIDKLVTSILPIALTQGTSSDTSEAYVGQWNELMVGVRTSLTVEVSRQAADATNSAFTSLQVWIRAYLRADVAVAQPSHFVVVTGVRP